MPYCDFVATVKCTGDVTLLVARNRISAGALIVTQVLAGYMQDVAESMRTLQTLRLTYADMSAELANKDRILAENDATIEKLRGEERGNVLKFQQESIQQLKAQCDKIVDLNKRIQALMTQNTELESELASTRLRERELALANERLTQELDRVTNEVECYRTSVDRRDLEMKDLSMTMDERVMVNVKLQERLEEVVKEAEERSLQYAIEAQVLCPGRLKDCKCVGQECTMTRL